MKRAIIQTTSEIVHGTPEWHLARSGCINISTAVNILYPGRDGVRGTPMTEYSRITYELANGVTEESLDAETEAMFSWGRESEPFHLAQLSVMYPNMKFRENKLMYSMDEMEYVKGTPDAFASDDKGNKFVVEMKAPVQFERWGNNCPIGPQTQCRLYMAMLNCESGMVSALIPPKPRTYHVVRDRDWEDWALSKLKIFWEENVMKNIPPQIDWTPGEADIAAYKMLYPNHVEGKVVEFNEEQAKVVGRWLDAKAKRSQLDEIEESSKAMIVGWIGDAEIAVLPTGESLTYKSSTRKYSAKGESTVTIRTLKYSK